MAQTISLCHSYNGYNANIKSTDKITIIDRLIVCPTIKIEEIL